MNSAVSDTAAIAGPLSTTRIAASHRADAGRAAWLALIPSALLALAAVVLLGPPVGRLLFSPDASLDFWHSTELRPEPVEQARYVLLIAAALLLAMTTVAATRWRSHLNRRLIAVAVPVAQLATIGFLVACWIGQQRPAFIGPYFTHATLKAAAVITVAVVAIARIERTRIACARLLHESRRRRIGILLVAIAMTAIWLLHAINSDQSIGWANSVTKYHIQFSFDETFAVINGLTPLVNFTAQYGSLWPYAIAAPLLLFGKTLLAFTIAMCSLTGIAVLAVFGILRRVTRSSLAALLLYLPFIATSFFLVWSDAPDPLVNRHTFASYFPVHPLRYAGPYLLAWLLARHLDRDRARPWPIFAAATLVMINNSEFGIAAFGATVAALLWTLPDHRPARVGRLAANVAAGVAVGVLLVSAVTLVRAGALPQFARSVEFARIYLVGGFSLIPLAGVLGLHLIIYATYVAAIGVATSRAIERAANRVLTGMLVWSGLFGLASAGYYVGRSTWETLPITFSAWAFALALLTVVAVRRIAESRSRVPSVVAVAVVFGMAVTACSLAQTPLPWAQLDRIQHPPDGQTASAEEVGPYAPVRDPALRSFVSSLADGPHRFVVRHGAPVALFATTGHRIADYYGIRDVLPYTGIESVQTRRQFSAALDALRSAGGNTVILPQEPPPEMGRMLAARGFEVATPQGLRRWHPSATFEAMPDAGGLVKWVDTRHLHPEALR